MAKALTRMDECEKEYWMGTKQRILMSKFPHMQVDCSLLSLFVAALLKH